MASLTSIELALTKHEIFLRPQPATGAASDSWSSFSTDAAGKLVFSRSVAGPPSASIAGRRTVIAVYGIFQLLRGFYLAVVTRSTAVAKGPYGSSIQQVQDMEWLPVHVREASQLSEEEEEDERTYLSLLQEISERDCFYFASGYDLTNCLQRFDAHLARALAAGAGGASGGAGDLSAAAASAGAAAGSAASEALPLEAAASALRPAVGTRLPDTNTPVERVLGTPSHRLPVSSTADDRFFWNKAACREMLEGGGEHLVTPFINGYVVQATGVRLSDGGLTEAGAVDVTLISRRGCARQGTRFNMRGADATGNVANYAETEQLVALANGSISSYVQVRGSIPLLWEQPVTMKYTPRVRIGHDEEAHTAVFAKHADAQLRVYGDVTGINLIDKKKDQKLLGDKYAAAVAKYRAAKLAAVGSAPAIGYDVVWFDFHHECRKMQWHNLSRLLDEVRTRVDRNGFYCKDGSGVVTRVQAGVFRTNCMDNLDRTNVVQSLFARRAALQGIPGAWEKTAASGCSVLTSPFTTFEHAFNNIWANNADAISLLYSGTGALKTDFTRTGKRTLAGAIADGVNSLKRYVLNNLVDGRTQDAWDLFTGRFVPHRAHLHSAASSGSLSSVKHHHRVHTDGSTTISVHLANHHGHHHGAASTSSGKLTPGATPLAFNPLQEHKQGPTPSGFFVQAFLFFATLTAFASAAVSVVVPKQSLAVRTSLGAGFAALVVGGIAYVLLAKGASFGKLLVSQPKFIRSESLVPPGRTTTGGAGGAPTADGGSGRVKLA